MANYEQEIVVQRLVWGSAGQPMSPERDAWLNQLPIHFLLTGALSHLRMKSDLLLELDFYEWCQDTGYQGE